MNRQYYDILFQQTNLGVAVLDPDFVITDANEALLKSVGKQRADVLGKKCHEVVKGFFAPCPVKEPGFKCPLLQTVRTGKSSHIIHEYALSEDQIAYFNIATYPIKNQTGEVVRVIELWRDITSEMTHRWEKRVKRIEADMRKMIQEDRLVSLGKLVASSVHEINNPIQGLITFSHIMGQMVEADCVKDDDLIQLREFVSHMKRELERCGNIVAGLLAFARESPLEFVNMDINDILATVISLTGHKIELSDIKLVTSLSHSPLIINGDRNQLQQCLLNLIFNAIEAMPEGGTLNISSGLNKKKKQVWIEIRDDGCGIKDRDMEHIFDPFFTTKAEGQGTGLGLSIVYGIIKDHEGDVKVTSKPGQGASFTISFPCTVME